MQNPLPLPNPKKTIKARGFPNGSPEQKLQETVKARKTGLMSNEGQFSIGGRQLDNCKNKMEVGWQSEKFYVLDDQMDLHMWLLQPDPPFVDPRLTNISSEIFHLSHENPRKSMKIHGEDLRVEAFKKRWIGIIMG